MANITLTQVAKAYGSNTILNDLSLEVHDGECFTLLGPSGCGKTVMLRLIAGFEVPDAGTITIGDTVVADGSTGKIIPPNDRGLGVVFQDYAVWPHKTVFGNIAYPLELAGVPADELRRRVMEAVDMVNLNGLGERLPSQLSGGQQQRVALARALVATPNLLLLDEPLCNLDANLREEMRFEIKALQRRLGITILYVTHDQEIALAISDRVAIMDHHGSIRQVGSPEAIFENPADDFVFRFMGVTNFVPVTITNGAAELENGLVLPWNPADSKAAGTAKTMTPAELEGTSWNVGFRPSDVRVLPPGQGLAATVRRASFLGAMTEYRLDLGGHELRTQVETLHALNAGTMFNDNDPCGLAFEALHWFATPTTEGGRA